MIKKIPERETIVASPKRRPYGSKLTLLLEEHTFFPIKGECTFLVSPELILRVAPSKDQKGTTSFNKWDIFVEGFATEGEAEQAGLKVGLGFLWAAVTGHYSVRLIYHTPLPCTVYNRNTSNGMCGSCHATLSVGKSIQGIVDPINQIISTTEPIDQKLLLSTELFASARLETTERAKFIGLVSSLEPLTNQDKYEIDELKSILKSFNQQIKESNLEIDIKNSISGRISQLNLESVSRSIKRLVEETLPNDDHATEVIQDAYYLRSKILHEGSSDSDLDIKSNEIEEVIRKIIRAKIDGYF